MAFGKNCPWRLWLTIWLEKKLGNLQNDFGLKEFAKNIEKMSLKEKLEAQQKIIKEMGKFMIDNSVYRLKLSSQWYQEMKLKTLG